METNELNDQLKLLLDGKYGTLTKVSADKYSEVSVGHTETGNIGLIEHPEGLMAMIYHGWTTFVKTSPIQSIELIEPIENGTRILFKTRTSTYEAVISNVKPQPIDENDDLTLE